MGGGNLVYVARPQPLGPVVLFRIRCMGILQRGLFSPVARLAFSTSVSAPTPPIRIPPHSCTSAPVFADPYAYTPMPHPPTPHCIPPLTPGGRPCRYVGDASDIREPLASVYPPGAILHAAQCPLDPEDVGARLRDMSTGLASLPRTGTAVIEYTWVLHPRASPLN
jgi:hypothetical protein